MKHIKLFESYLNESYFKFSNEESAKKAYDLLISVIEDSVDSLKDEQLPKISGDRITLPSSANNMDIEWTKGVFSKLKDEYQYVAFVK